MNKVICLLVLLASMCVGYSQGFVNLNSENANVSTFGLGLVPSIDGIPGWTVYVNGSEVSQIVFNTQTLDEPVVTLQGTNSHFIPPIQGLFSVVLKGGSVYAQGNSSAIGQTGQIPFTARSFSFWGGADNVSFNGHPLAIVLLEVGSTSNYNIYGTYVSAYAGQTGQLLFTASKPFGALIDNIQFSSSPVPEPSTFALSVIGGLLLGFRRWKKDR
jgi:hypothetical protein